jgi:hypothetical protein
MHTTVPGCTKTARRQLQPNMDPVVTVPVMTTQLIKIAAICCFLAAGVFGYLTYSDIVGPSRATATEQLPGNTGNTIAWHSHQIATMEENTVPVGQIQIHNPDGPQERREGICTGTLIGPDRIITANHCFTALEPNATATFSAKLYTDIDGAVIRPHGTCQLNMPAGVVDQPVGKDVLVLTSSSCDRGDKNVGERAGIMETTRIPPEKWYAAVGRNAPTVTAYGYPRTDEYGIDIKGMKLYSLETEPAAVRRVVEQNVSPNVLVVRHALETGASGGPIIADTTTGRKVIATIARKEAMSSVEVPYSMSGVGLRKAM